MPAAVGNTVRLLIRLLLSLLLHSWVEYTPTWVQLPPAAAAAVGNPARVCV
jgi:hypothetical protein